MISEVEALRQRHSVRKYIEKPLAKDIEDKLKEKIVELNKESGLNFQLVTDEPKAFSKSMLNYGTFIGVSNYVMAIGKDSDTMAYRVGYYGEKLVIFAQQLGLQSCWVGLTYKRIPGAYDVAADEKIYCCIAIGYGDGDGVQSKSKTPGQVSNVSSHTPEWFKEGVEAALLAPTAVNQQKFYFEFLPPLAAGRKARVRPSRKFSVVGYTKIDLGIAMCNFEIGAGKENFDWELPDGRV